MNEEVTSVCQKLLEHPDQGLSVKLYLKCYSKIFQELTNKQESAEEIYNQYNQLIENYLQKIVIESKTIDDVELLNYFNIKWDNYKMAIRCLDGMFAYLNRTWIKNAVNNDEKVRKIRDQANFLWKDQFFQALAHRLTKKVLELLRLSRSGRMIDDHHIIGTINCYNQISDQHDYYFKYFEPDLLASLTEYYTIESNEKNNSFNIRDYLKYILSEIKSEINRGTHYGYIISIEKIETILNQTLITNHLPSIIDGIDGLIEQESHNDLKRMYLVLKRVEDGLTPMIKKYHDHIIKTAKSLLTGLETPISPQVLVESLLKLYRQFNGMTSTISDDDPLFVKVVDQAFTIIVNQMSKQTSSYLARYFDSIMKKNSSHDETTLDQVTDDLIVLFKYIDDKDVFMLNYQKLMCRRLILNTSAGHHSEKIAISKLKTNHGNEYCHKLQRMLQDIQVSEDSNLKFQDDCREQEIDLGFSFSVKVLAHGIWPISSSISSSNLILPKFITDAIGIFKTFYDKQNSGRKLTYLHQNSRAMIKANSIMNGRLKLQTTAFQTIILFLFNNANVIPYGDLINQTGLEEKELKISLLGLIKTRVLLCNHGIKHDEWDKEETIFKVNTKLKSKRLNMQCAVPINLGQLKSSSTPEVNQTEIRRDRDLKLHAVMVRIMKSRKTLSHNDLIVETVSQTKMFKPAIKDIKRNIEYLIDQEYFERGENRTYNYLA